jgi:hypothetical protein
MQAKITAARREAEGLKDKIKRRKDELADSSRTSPYPLSRPGCDREVLHPARLIHRD